MKQRGVFSLHLKIPFIFCLLFLIAFSLVAVFFRSQFESQLITSYASNITSQGNTLSRSIGTIFESTNRNTMTELNELLHSAVTGEVASIEFVNSNYQLLATTDTHRQEQVYQVISNESVNRALSAQVSSQFIEEGSEGSHLKVYIPVVSDTNQTFGVVVVTARMGHIYEQVTSVTNMFLGIMIIVLLVTLVVAIIISNQMIAKPISQIERKMKHIADKQYDTEDVTINTRDELGTLATQINRLAINIKATKDLTESERQRLDSVLMYMSDGVIATDRRGNVILVNEAALTLLDTSQEKVLHEPLIDVFKLRNKYNYRQLLETQDELIMTVPSPSDGQATIIRTRFSVIKRESGFISGIVCVLSDITEQEKIEQERRDFVSNVSHELRTPLTSMRSYTETLIDGAWRDDKLAPMFLEVIQSEQGRMIRLVNDLLELSKMDSDVDVMSMDIIELNHLFARVLDRFDMLIASEDYAHKSYRIKREFSDTTLWIEGDRDKIIQVIDNLMNNALKYSPDGGVITCRLVESGNNAVISVTDEGLGIPKKAIPQLFNRFYRVDKARSRAQGGTGLGLSISKEVVERHHGKIWVTSVENHGSTFFVSLPKVDLVDEFE